MTEKQNAAIHKALIVLGAEGILLACAYFMCFLAFGWRASHNVSPFALLAWLCFNMLFVVVYPFVKSLLGYPLETWWKDMTRPTDKDRWTTLKRKARSAVRESRVDDAFRNYRELIQNNAGDVGLLFEAADFAEKNDEKGYAGEWFRGLEKCGPLTMNSYQWTKVQAKVVEYQEYGSHDVGSREVHQSWQKKPPVPQDDVSGDYTEIRKYLFVYLLVGACLPSVIGFKSDRELSTFFLVFVLNLFLFAVTFAIARGALKAKPASANRAVFHRRLLASIFSGLSVLILSYMLLDTGFKGGSSTSGLAFVFLPIYGCITSISFFALGWAVAVAVQVGRSCMNWKEWSERRALRPWHSTVAFVILSIALSLGVWYGNYHALEKAAQSSANVAKLVKLYERAMAGGIYTDKDYNLLNKLARNPNSPTELLRKLARTQGVSRYSLVANPATPTDLLEHITRNAGRYLRQYASEKLRERRKAFSPSPDR